MGRVGWGMVAGVKVQRRWAMMETEAGTAGGDSGVSWGKVGRTRR